MLLLKANNVKSVYVCVSEGGGDNLFIYLFIFILFCFCSFFVFNLFIHKHIYKRHIKKKFNISPLC